ncbi:MAG TPA: DUF72 domain-containing protein [Candidatus Limnocylindria bacterium]|nr:DUF72 domain-containing protein [Candidatus Limnocylindria bacterium]
MNDTLGPHDPGPDAAGRRGEAHAEAAREPLTIGAATVRIGTASWTDPTMTAPGVFYPPDAGTAEERLVYYANQFPIVEVDSTYYALPARRTGELWLERTPADFTFDIKAHALMTGQPSEPKRLPKDLREALPADLAGQKRVYARELPPEIEDEIWARFLDGIEPLRSSGKLGAVFLQYPRWFFPTSESRDEIVKAKERLGDTPFAVELRHASWFNEKNRQRTIDFLHKHQIPFVMVDAPPGTKSSVPPVTVVSSPNLAVVRFHGRRTETWEATGIPVVERFRYLYDEGELSEWVPRIQEAADQVPEIHVLMNNCYANYGTTNAREIAELLAASVPRLDR